ncbi:hypothetical protein M9H77_22540 [Catharanthus roseus]|uniref:Uncharacterized protein n=1 Tax=Catharanthus roseus TaxID=4058 RepID=A0ACC0ARZ7_CATRO|nr:hypothetical protein M9H77_22540 [Catharanthus roseus]
MAGPASANSGIVIGGWKIKHHSLMGFFLMTLVFAAFYILEENNNRPLLEAQNAVRKSISRCNLFSGKWVYDEKSRPLYKEEKCSFMIGDFSCEKYGRNDFKYQHWRWQPHDCDLPRFNATAFLEKLRDKRLVFVGDSLNKNQWVSMLCLIESATTSSSLNETAIWKGSLITYHSSEYNATVDFYWEPLLVESNCDDPVDHHVQDRIIRFQSIEKHAQHWTNADFLVFNSFMWWLSPNMTLLWGSFNSPDSVYKKEPRRPRHLEMALRTWSDWLDLNINRTKTKMFFMSLSPFHQMGDDWGAAPDQNCYGETEPIWNERYWGKGTERCLMEKAEAAIQELEEMRGLKIQYINITQLSDKRRDGHPSIYRKRWKEPTKEELLNPSSYSDCVHWCLPGVPDVWNELLYAYIMYS